MKILYVSPLENACTYYRCTLPSRHINKNGWAESRVVRAVTKEYLDWGDLIIFQRIVSDMMWYIVKYCKLVGKKVVYELDDNIFMYPDSPEYKKDNVQAETISAIKILRLCDAVTVTTEGIKKTIGELVDTPVYVLPNQIDFADIEGLNITAQRENMVMGWAGGHYHVQDLTLIDKPLQEIMEKYPKVMLAMFGGLVPKNLYDKYQSRIFVQPFVPIEDFHLWMSMFKFDIGLAPLYGTEFAKSRSNLRLLQYGAMGIPVIASDYGEYGRILGNGLAGVCVADGEWVDAISRLIESQDERKSIADRAKDYVKSNFDIAKNVGLWRDCYQEVMDGKGS